MLLAVLAVVGCEHEDKAKPDYDRCLKLELIRSEGLPTSACMAAWNADWTSPSAKAAMQKANDLEAKLKQADQAAVADRPRALAEAKKKVDRHFYNHEKDGECVDKGLPAYRWSYEGGTRQEVDFVAVDYGCRHLFDSESFDLFKVFCCPGSQS